MLQQNNPPSHEPIGVFCPARNGRLMFKACRLYNFIQLIYQIVRAIVTLLLFAVIELLQMSDPTPSDLCTRYSSYVNVEADI